MAFKRSRRSSIQSFLSGSEVLGLLSMGGWLSIIFLGLSE